MRYVIIYINDITVQEHCVYCLDSGVNILLLREGSKGNTYLSYVGFNLYVWVSISLMWGIVGFICLFE